MKTSSSLLFALILILMAIVGTSTAEAQHIEVRQQEPIGSYLTDGEGMSLYLFLKDSKGKSTCYNKCAEAWPPLLANGGQQLQAGQGVQSDLLGTIKRKDGSVQVTYNGWPLYYYVKDNQPGDIKGQDIKGFGAEWYLVTPDGHQAEGGG